MNGPTANKGVLWRVVLLGCLATAAGCSRPKPVPPKESQNPEPSSSSPAQADEILKNVVAILQNNPTADAFPLALKQLNEYVARRPEAIGALPNARRDQIAAAMGGSVLPTVEQKQFSQPDAEALKDALFLQSVVRSTVRETDGDLDAALRLFEWTVRQVELTPEGWQPQGPPYEVCVRGSGDANERIWVFQELLRQAGLTGCVVGVPGDKPDDPIRPWFCGLIREGAVYLFDPRYGLPVRNVDGSVATLKHLAENPKLVESFVVEPALPYPIALKALRGFSLLLLVEPCTVSPRMQFLQERLSGGQRVNLHADFDKLLEAASSAVQAIADNQGVRLWQYPLIVRDRSRAGRRELIASLNLTWLSNPKSARMLQLRGEYDKAVKEFAEMDLQRVSPASVHQMLASRSSVPAEIRRRMVSQTMQDVLYFGGMCQLERERPQPNVALDWFARYLEQYGGCTVRADEILEPGRLCNEILQQAESSAPSVGGRLINGSAPIKAMLTQIAATLKELETPVSPGDKGPPAVVLSAPQRAEALTKSLREASASSEPLAKALEPAFSSLAGVQPAGDPEGAVAAAMRLREGLLEALAAWINEQLFRRDFFDPALLKLSEHPMLQVRLADLAAATRDPWNGAVLVEVHRMLLDAAFPGCMTEGRPVWIAGVLREKARALAMQQKEQEARDLLRQGHPLLLSIQRAELLALSKVVGAPAKADAEKK